MYDPVKLVQVAVSQLGVSEVGGTNDGADVRKYQAVTGAYRAAWCASFVQWCLVQVGCGPIADRSAGVFYIVDYARRHGWITKTPRPGDLVAFMEGQGHIGIVRTTSFKGFTTVEGNADNRVESNSYGLSGPYAFVRVPGSHTPVRKTLVVPRFQVVASKNGKAKVVVSWGKWKAISTRVPSVVAAYGSARIQRKLVKTVVVR